MIPYAGAIIGSYTSTLAPTLNLNQPTRHKEKYKVISKAWRASLSTLHPDTNRFLVESQLDSNQDEELIKITTAIKKLQVIPTMKVMLHKIINNALYAGKIARDYQIQKKGITPGSKVLIHNTCIYCEYRFSDGYIPKLVKNTTTHITTYQWILWDSPVAHSVWKQRKLVLQDINIQMQANSYQEAILLLERLSIVTDDQI